MTLDATVAGANANSYLTIADADALAAVDFGRNAEAWLAASAGEKEKALMTATAMVDAHVGGVQARASEAQLLLFPRVIDYAGTPSVAFIHAHVRRATYKQAAYLIVNEQLLADAEERRARGLFSFSDQDGGGTIALDPEFGRMSPDAVGFLKALRYVRQAGIASVQIGSSYRPADMLPTDLIP